MAESCHLALIGVKGRYLDLDGGLGLGLGGCRRVFSLAIEARKEASKARGTE